MPEFSEDGGLLQALRDEPIPPSTLDIGDLVARGRRKVQTRNWIGAAAITAVLVAAIPVALVNARSPNASPEQPPLATPSQAVTAPTSCTLEVLPIAAGYTGSSVSGGDSSGRFLTGSISRDGETAPVVWDNGVIMPLSFPPGTGTVAVNRYGVIAGFSANVAWVYRDGKYLPLPQPPGNVIYRPIAINDKGQIAGAVPGPVVKGQTGYPPIIWGADDTVQAVADRSFIVRGIDDDGTVIGQENLRLYPGDLHGLIWRPGRAVADLPTPRGVNKAGAMSIRDGWAGGVIAYDTATDGPLKPFIFHLGTGQSVALPSEVATVEDVNSRGWAVVSLQAASGHVTRPGLLADGKLLRLPEPAGTSPGQWVAVHTISDDGRVLSGGTGSGDGSPSAKAVRWLCQ